MGEWSDYFEDFPEENPANYIDGKFNPELAAQTRAANDKVNFESNELKATIKRMAEEGKQRAKQKNIANN